jgi:hypothetical protein
MQTADEAPPASEASTSETPEGEPYPDLIKWPDEPPPPPEMWEIEPKFDWEREERGYIFETRLEDAAAHKEAGNVAFAAEEWEVALRRYKRAIYSCHFDEMQMHDLMDHHKEMAHAIQASTAAAAATRSHAHAPPSLRGRQRVVASSGAARPRCIAAHQPAIPAATSHRRPRLLGPHGLSAAGALQAQSRGLRGQDVRDRVRRGAPAGLARPRG